MKETVVHDNMVVALGDAYAGVHIALMEQTLALTEQ